MEEAMDMNAMMSATNMEVAMEVVMEVAMEVAMEVDTTAMAMEVAMMLAMAGMDMDMAMASATIRASDPLSVNSETSPSVWKSSIRSCTNSYKSRKISTGTKAFWRWKTLGRARS
mmetsp:Transcript_85479/g.151202  ORF Transcript_85479/g.151202 Transcript_85479/m.151202 type:complete len:115 (+) Transcript_85479:1163-1507(+)